MNTLGFLRFYPCRRGMMKVFTLIELLVVISIIAILASLLLPTLARARYQARVAVCIGQHKQYAIGAMMYTDDYDDFYPDGKYYYTSGSYRPVGRGMGWDITPGKQPAGQVMNAFGTYFNSGDWSTNENNRFRNLTTDNPLFRCPQSVTEIIWDINDNWRPSHVAFISWRFSTFANVTPPDPATLGYENPGYCMQKVGQTWRLEAVTPAFDGLRFDILSMDALTFYRHMDGFISGGHMWGGERLKRIIDGGSQNYAPTHFGGIGALHTNIFSHTDGHVSTHRATSAEISTEQGYALGQKYDSWTRSEYFPTDLAVDD